MSLQIDNLLIAKDEDGDLMLQRDMSMKGSPKVRLYLKPKETLALVRWLHQTGFITIQNHEFQLSQI